MSKELSEKLCNVFFRNKIDYEEIAQLMKQGADPLGPLMDEDETA